MIYDAVARRLVFPAAWCLRGGGRRRLLNEREKTQWLSRDELASMQLAKLKATLSHAAARVPLYRETFRKVGFQPGDLKAIDDLCAVPILEKALVRERTADLCAPGVAGKLRAARTAGSTGEPLSVPVGASVAAAAAADAARCRRWWGLDLGDRIALLWGHARRLSPARFAALRTALSRAEARALNRILLAAYDLCDDRLQSHWRRIERFRPKSLIGYATALYALADFILRRGRPGPSLGLAAVISTAETLYDWQAAAIREAFACPVVNEYGMSEVGIIAYECPSGSMHVMDESVVVEVVNCGETGVGNIIVTELENPAAPLIRYDTGDVASAAPGKCACGRGLSRIGRVEGRVYDVIHAADGRPASGALLTHVMKSVPGIARFQVLERAVGRLDITYAAAAPLGERDRQSIVGTLKKHLGAVDVALEFRCEIQAEPSGKHRWLKSLVPPEAAARTRKVRL